MKNNFNNLLGILFLGAGAFFILSIMGFLSVGISQLLISWPMILIVVGLVFMALRNWWGGLITFLVGLYFMLPRIIRFLEIDTIERQVVNQWFWAFSFLMLGLLLIIRPKNWPFSFWGKNIHVHQRNGLHKIEYAFGDYQYVPVDKPFLGASISAGFSTLTIDLSSVVLEKDRTVLEVNGGFSTVTLLIPDDIYVVSQEKAFFGEVDDQRQEFSQRKTGDPILELVGNMAFGSLKIHSLRSRRADSSVEESSETDDTPNEMIENITVKLNKEVHIIPLDEVKYIQSEGDYVNLITAQGIFLKEETMKFYQNSLPTEKFLRIHRSYIVNLSEISSISSQGKETYYVVLKDGTQLKASLQGYQLLKQKWDL